MPKPPPPPPPSPPTPPTPRPLLTASTHCCRYNACPNPPPSATASTHKFLQASNACPNPLRPHRPPTPPPPHGPYCLHSRPNPRPLQCVPKPPPTALTAYTPTPHGPYCLYRESCLHSLLYIESSYRPPIKLHIARVDQHSSIARLGVGGTGGSH